MARSRGRGGAAGTAKASGASAGGSPMERLLAGGKQLAAKPLPAKDALVRALKVRPPPSLPRSPPSPSPFPAPRPPRAGADSRDPADPVRAQGVVKVLEEAEQGDRALMGASKVVATGLVQKLLLNHRDQDVRLLVAGALSLLLRLHAPECPYSDAAMQEVFGLFFWVFRRLAAPPSAAHFARCLTVLHAVKDVQCCILMLDFSTEAPVLDLFSVLLGCLNAGNFEQLKQPVVETLAAVLEQVDELSLHLMDVVLGYLVQRQNHPEAHHVARELVRHTRLVIQPAIQQWLNSVIIDGNAYDSELKDDYHALILELYAVAPDMLLPVLPNLARELQVDDTAKRVAATELLSALLTLPGGLQMAEDYKGLFADYLNRFKDKLPEVRVKALRGGHRILADANALDYGAAAKAIFGAMRERLSDYDDAVRAEAVTALGALFEDRPSAMDGEVVGDLCNRLRDKKLPVRVAVVTQLVAAFRTYIARLHDEDAFLPDEDEEAISFIPDFLLKCYVPDTQLRARVLEKALSQSLFPKDIPVQQQAAHWVTIYSDCDEKARAGFGQLLGKQHNLCKLVQDLLRMRLELRKYAAGKAPAAEGEGGDKETIEADPAVLKARLEAAVDTRIRRAVRLFPDLKKAYQGLKELMELKDNNVFRDLATLVAPGQESGARREACASIQRAVKGRGPVQPAMDYLCTVVAKGPITGEHMQSLIEKILEDDSNPAFLAAALELMAGVSDACPNAFAGCVDEVLSLLQKGGDMATCATCILAKIAIADRAALGPARGALVDVVRGEGGPAYAKHAVRALVNVFGAEEAAAILKPELEAMLGATEADAQMCLARALGEAGRKLPDLFENFAQALGDRAESLLEVGFLDKTDATAAVLCAVLKAVGHGCVPEQGKPGPAATELVGRAVKCLANGWLDPLTESRKVVSGNAKERECVRLAGASCVARLERSHQVELRTLYEAGLVMQDPAADNRRAFAKKAQATMQHLYFKSDPAAGPKAAERGHAWLAILSLASIDPDSMHRTKVFTQARYCAEMLRGHCQAREATFAATVWPEYAVLNAVHLLAHHPDFPEEATLESPDACAEAMKNFKDMLVGMLEILSVNETIPPLARKLLRMGERLGDASASGSGLAAQKDAAFRLRLLALLGGSLAQCLANPEQDKQMLLEAMPSKFSLPLRLFCRAPEGASKAPLPFELPKSIMKLDASYVRAKVLKSPDAQAVKRLSKKTKRAKAAAAAPKKAPKLDLEQTSPARRQPGRGAKKDTNFDERSDPVEDLKDMDSAASAQGAAPPPEPLNARNARAAKPSGRKDAKKKTTKKAQHTRMEPVEQENAAPPRRATRARAGA